MDPHVAGTQSRSVFVGTATHPLLVSYPTSINPTAPCARLSFKTVSSLPVQAEDFCEDLLKKLYSMGGGATTRKYERLGTGRHVVRREDWHLNSDN
ncbi:hypothetical protein JWS13_03625 (plasmid) [Rhodococcus pseudokoreensis]|uniref:Uncharacterized protein n=1 Tax=Rhodococcus pseudokoreensis TaxID=2811421 RepID=A0A974VZ64_9NOCA|nr:hypothetical protein JWS13_03625 [Rhodococcus pseudokoreensis]